MDTTITNTDSLMPARILRAIRQLPESEAKQAAYAAVRALSQGVKPIQVLLYVQLRYAAKPAANRNAGMYRARPNNEMTSELKNKN